MPLISALFRGDVALEECLVRDAAHVIPGSTGEHVAKIQTAVSRVDGYSIRPEEIANRYYGHSTAQAVLEFKTRRRIINTSYQSQADNIVGKMTIATLDKAVALLEQRPPPSRRGAWSAG